jgi:DNA-binding NarL/FixJ family response regulator
MTIRIVLGEDNVLVREGVGALLDSYEDIDVVGVAEDAPTLLAAAEEHQPDVVVTDIKMPRTSSSRDRLRARDPEQAPGTGVVVLSAHDDEAYAIALLGKGQSGLAYLLKDRIAQGDELVRAIREVDAGRQRSRPDHRGAALRPPRDRGGRSRAPRLMSQGSATSRWRRSSAQRRRPSTAASRSLHEDGPGRRPGRRAPSTR